MFQLIIKGVALTKEQFEAISPAMVAAANSGRRVSEKKIIKLLDEAGLPLEVPGEETLVCI